MEREKAKERNQIDNLKTFKKAIDEPDATLGRDFVYVQISKNQNLGICNNVSVPRSEVISMS